MDPFNDIEGIDAYGFSDFFSEDPEADVDANNFDNEFYEAMPGEELIGDD